VFLGQAPIFLGGQGGLVGPSRIAYGTIIPAGTICRQDVLEEGMLYVSPSVAAESRKFAPGIYRGINRIVENNLLYIGNLWALRAWYQHVRVRTMSSDVFTSACHAGALKRMEAGLTERIKRLKELAGKMLPSLERACAETRDNLPLAVQAQQRALSDRWPEMEAQLQKGPPAAVGAAKREAFLEEWEKIETSSGHIKAIGSLSPSARGLGVGWLQEIVDSASVIWERP
jgi:UDP-N-acetylglucosamine/UDP-N-acetylgalactosamine diphosphorylase